MQLLWFSGEKAQPSIGIYLPANIPIVGKSFVNCSEYFSIVVANVSKTMAPIKNNHSFIMLRLYALLIDIRGIARSVRVIDLAEELTYQCETMLWVIFVGATGVGPKV